MSYLDDLVNFVINEITSNQYIVTSLLNDRTDAIHTKINSYLDSVEDVVFQNVKFNNSVVANQIILYEKNILKLKTSTNNSLLTLTINSLSTNMYVNQLNNSSTIAATLAYDTTNAAYVATLQASNVASILALRTIIDSTSNTFTNSTTATLTALRNSNIASTDAFIAVSSTAKDALLAENIGTDTAYLATATASFAVYTASNNAATNENGLILSKVTLTTAFNGIKAAADLAHSNSITSYNLKISTIITATELANTTALNTYIFTNETVNTAANTAYSATIAAYNTQNNAAKAAQQTAESAILATYTTSIATTTGTTAITMKYILENVSNAELTKAIDLKKAEFQELINLDTIIATTAENNVTDVLQKDLLLLIQNTSSRKIIQPIPTPISTPILPNPVLPPILIPVSITPISYLDDLVNYVVNEVTINQDLVTVLLNDRTDEINTKINTYLDSVEDVVFQNVKFNNSVIANQIVLYETNILNLKTETNNSLLTSSINSLSSNAYVNELKYSNNAPTIAATLAYNTTNAAYIKALQLGNNASILRLRTIIDATSTAFTNTTTATLTAFRDLNITSTNALLILSSAAKDALLAENVGTDDAYIASATAAFVSYKASNEAATNEDGLILSKATLTTAFNGIKAAADLAHSNSITSYNLKISTVITSTELANATALKTYIFTIKKMNTVAHTAYSATIAAYNTQNNAAKASQQTAESAVLAAYTSTIAATTGTTAITMEYILQNVSNVELIKAIELKKAEFQALTDSDTIIPTTAKNNATNVFQKNLSLLIQDTSSRKVTPNLVIDPVIDPSIILQCDTDNVIHMKFNSHVLNEKINIIKDVHNNTISQSSDNLIEETQKLIIDSISLNKDDLVKGINEYSNILSIGSLSLLYKDIKTFLKTFFALDLEKEKFGFSTLYDTNKFLNSDDDFTNEIFFNMLSDNSIAKKVDLNIHDITSKLRFAIDNNTFRNRSAETLISDGFMKDDKLHIVDDIQLSVHTNVDMCMSKYKQGIINTKLFDMKGIKVVTIQNEKGRMQCKVTNTISTSIYITLI
jgi:hypothetical protein